MPVSFLPPHHLHTQIQPRSTHGIPNMSQYSPNSGGSQQSVYGPPEHLSIQFQSRSTHGTPNMSQNTPNSGNGQHHTRIRYQVPILSISTHGTPNMSQNAPNSGNGQHRTQIRYQLPTEPFAPTSDQGQLEGNSGNGQHHTQIRYQLPTQPLAPTSDQGQSEAENEHLNAQAAVLLNSFLAKTRRPFASELENDMSCTICSEPFLRGSNPEVPVRLDCGHIFGMNCILKWLSPVSRNGNNNCPNCRHPVFDDWDKMDFPAARPMRPIRRGAISAASPQVNSTPIRASPDTVSAADVSGGRRGGRFPLRYVPPPWLRTQEAFSQPQAAARNETRSLFPSTPDDTTAGRLRVLQSQVQHEEATLELGEFDAARMRSRLARSREQLRRLESDSLTLSNAQRAIATPLTTTATRPSEDEENIDGVAAMFSAAETEHAQRRQQAVTNERKRYMWMQFCEGVVRTIEQSTNSNALANYDTALTVINMRDIDEFMAERAVETPTWRRILQTFPRLHTEMVTRFDDFRPLPSINIDDRMELERLLASTRFDRETVHIPRWYTRLSECLIRGAATSNHEATLARLTEQVASFSGPSTTASSGGQSAWEDEMEIRRMEDYLRGSGAATARRVTAASVNAALRAGAAENSAMTMVTRL